MRLLITDQCPVSGPQRGNTAFPTGFPKNLIAAQEGEMHTRVTGGFSMSALLARPVFIVTNGQKHLVILDEGTVSVAVHTGEIADVITVRL